VATCSGWTRRAWSAGASGGARRTSSSFGYLRDHPRWTESRLYFLVVWTLIASGTAILLSGFDQPLSLVVVAAALSGGVMFIYSMLLLVINRRFLPGPLKVRGLRLLVLLWATGLFGVMSVLVVINEAGG
jgi:vacuolar-type H+-ATPase subunit I/STV1